MLDIQEVQLLGRIEHVKHGVVHGMHCLLWVLFILLLGVFILLLFIYDINGYGHYSTHWLILTY